MKHVLLDTNVYIDWLNQGAREALMLGPGLLRHLCAIVVLELRVGARARDSLGLSGPGTGPAGGHEAGPPEATC